jgi:hypothetical protein
MKNYKIIKIKNSKEETETEIHKLFEEGWEIVCSYAYDNSHLILRRIKLNRGKNNARRRKS